jgi:diguanylate cyclase (GGDEF)-like protein
MQHWRHSKIGRRFVGVVVMSVVIAVTVVTLLFALLQIKEHTQGKKQEVAVTGQIIATAVAQALTDGRMEDVRRGLHPLTRLEGVELIQLQDTSGKVLLTVGQKVFMPDDLAVLDASPLMMLTRGSFAVSVDVRRNGATVGNIVLVVEIDGLKRKLLAALTLLPLGSVIAILFGYIAASRFHHTITGPIQRLTQAMHGIVGRKTYDTQVDVTSSDETGQLAAAFNTMMAEVNKRDQALAQLAYQDPLTGLGNRAAFNRDIALQEQAATLGKACILYLVDLDGFKSINDVFGHSVGDELLAGVGARLSEEFPDSAKLYRIGGDEFALLVDGNPSPERIENIAARTLALLQPAFVAASGSLFVGASLGAAIMPGDADSAADLYRRADLALFAAKRGGAHRFVRFTARMEDDVRERAELARDLRIAIEQRKLEAHYQLQVDSVTGEVTGLEALMRWNHPTRGYVSPAIFIPVAEEANLICDIGIIILQNACHEAMAMVRRGDIVPVMSVNVSISQIKRADFFDSISKALTDSGLPPELLCLEITESVFMGDGLKYVRGVIEQVRRLGVTMALDDFGTGYSSLAYLRDLPVDKLKIDRAFVTGIDTDLQKRRLLKGLIELGQTLDKSIIVEGVETLSELAALRAMGQVVVQGYVHARPVAPDGLLDAIAAVRRSSHLPAQRSIA